MLRQPVVPGGRSLLLVHRKILSIKGTKIGTEIDRWAAAAISSAQETDREETPNDAKSSIPRRAEGGEASGGGAGIYFLTKKREN